MATVRMSLANVLDLMDLGLANGNVQAVRNLIGDLRVQALQVVEDVARLDWLESRGHVSLGKEDGVACIWDTPPCVGNTAPTLREAIDKYRCNDS